MVETRCPNFEDKYDEVQYLELEAGVWGPDLSVEVYYCKYCYRYAVFVYRKGQKPIRRCFDTFEEAYQYFGEVIKDV